MKKLILYALLACTGSSFAQDNETWRVGLQCGMHSSNATPTGGMYEANARFNYNEGGGGAFGLLARYDHNKRFMLLAGLGIHGFGFGFSLSENYSLLRPERRNTAIKADFAALEVPIMFHYKFDPNCRNAKWLVGAGWAIGAIGAQSKSQVLAPGGEQNVNAKYIKSEASANEGLYAMLRFSVGREKLFKHGGILNASFVLNASLKQLATASVDYRVDGQDYHHEFTNNGCFAGFRVSYFLRALPKQLTP